MNRTQYQREYARKRRADPAGREQNRRVSAAWRLKNYQRVALTTLRQRAKARGIEFNLTPADVDWPLVCPVLGVELIYGGGKGSHPHSASFDRRDPTKGYVPGNVFIMSWRANRIKNDATVAELRALLDYLETDD